MLGLGKNTPSWNWVAHGKHPCARDYVSIGQEDPLSQAFSGWVDKGYDALDQRIKRTGTRSWRFWARTPKGDVLIVGIVRDSCDAIGRPYPLILLGTGPVRDWKNKWHLLPYACDGTWTQMERLAARTYADASHLRDELASALRFPIPEWDGYEHQVNQTFANPNKQSTINEIRKKVDSFAGASEFVVEIDTGALDSALSVLTLWHTLLRQRASQSPSAVFMGGTGTSTFMAVYNRALSAGDFANLWSTGMEEEQRKWS